MIELMWPHLKWEDLDEKYQKSVQFVRDHHIGVCARCGWSRGCERCDAEKAEKYWWRQQIKQETETKKRGRPSKKP